MKKIQIQAKIEAGDGGGAYVLFPYDTGKEFATKGRWPVRRPSMGFLYGSLIKYGKPFICWVCLKPYAANWEKPGDTLEVVVLER